MKKTKIKPVLQPRQVTDPILSNPPPLPRGLFSYFTPNEWRLLTGFEVSAKKQRVEKKPGVVEFRSVTFLDLYLGIGPILFRLTL